MRMWKRDHPRSGKTLKLPNGELSLRARKGRLVYADESKVIAWALNNCPDLIRHEPKLAKSKINELAAEMANDGDATDPPEPANLHRGTVQTVNDSRGRPYLAQTYMLLATVGEGDDAERVTIPGVFWAAPAEGDEDSFDLRTIDQTNQGPEESS
jgi:hypothetical protein